MVANMGFSYPQLLKDVCGWEAAQWERILASVHATLCSVPSIGKRVERGQLYHHGFAYA